MKNKLFSVALLPSSCIIGIGVQITFYPDEPNNRWMNIYIGILFWEFSFSIKRR